MSHVAHELASPAEWARCVLRFRDQTTGRVTHWKRYRWLDFVSQQIVRAFVRGEYLLICAPPQHGKALRVDTPIPTPIGWRAIGDLRQGDYVFSEKGIPVRVRMVSQVWRDRPLVRVHSSEIEPIYADAAHEWVVRLCRKHKAWTRRESGYLADRESERRPLIAPTLPLQIESKDYNVDPWLLGYWLGDGTARSATLTVGDHDRDWVTQKLSSKGITYKVRKDGLVAVRETQHRLRSMGLLRNKHIPEEYLWGAESARRDLLNGLVDSDGYVSPGGQVEYCTTSKRLADEVSTLVRSLGVKCAVYKGDATLNGRRISDKYRVCFYMAGAASMPRKSMLCKDGKRNPGHYAKFDRVDEVGDTVCIEVDSPTHMFLAGRSMVPTCNSVLSTLATPTWWIMRSSLLGIPTRGIIAAYNAKYARGWGDECRKVIKEFGARYGAVLRTDRNAADALELTNGCKLMTAGLQSGITGNPADFFIVDDPIKNAAQADSKTFRDRAWDEMGRAVETRLQLRAPLVMLNTLWHPDDPGSRIIKSQSDPKAPRWRIIRLPAIAGTSDPLGRKPGEALCPEMRPLELLEQRRQSPMLGRRGWLALYQQQPVPDEGSIWRSSYWRTHRLMHGGRVLWPDGDPSQEIEVATLSRFATVDLALGSKDGDQTVIGVWGYDPQGQQLYLLDLKAGAIDVPATKRILRDLLKTQEDRPHQRVLRVWVESVQYQAAVVQDLQYEGLAVSPIKPDRDKAARLRAVEPWGEQRRISHDADAHWRDELERQLLEFTGKDGDSDDIVDVWSYGARVAMDGKAGGGDFAVPEAAAMPRPRRHTAW